ncbi:hypothetical protein AJ88_44130 [Mesorhizobium amorphae CCBAU 01583]|nr:hypothetical protein AJ88_44130 [Mesorhizobium amorphae CCBAU 01583]
MATITATKKPSVNSSVLPVEPKPSSRMIASSAVPKKKPKTATVATVISSQLVSRFKSMTTHGDRAAMPLGSID